MKKKKWLAWVISILIVVAVASIWLSLMKYVLAVILLIAALILAVLIFIGCVALAMFLGGGAADIIEKFISKSGGIKAFFGVLLVPTFGYLLWQLFGLTHVVELQYIGSAIFTVFFFVGYLGQTR